MNGLAPTTCSDPFDVGQNYQGICGGRSNSLTVSTATSSPSPSPTASPVVAKSTEEDETCFSGDVTLTLSSGESKVFSEVQVGDEVLTTDANGALSFAPIVALPHARNHKVASFLQNETSSGKTVKATKMHLLKKCDGSLVYAKSLSHGDCLRTVNGNEAVTAVSVTKAIGIYTAVTTNEFLVVNGIVASPFAVAHGLLNAFYSLHRALVTYFPLAFKSSFLLAANTMLGNTFIIAGK